jgi:hypothetical protein
MSKAKKLQPVNKKELLRDTDHLTVPPRLESSKKNTRMEAIKKKRSNVK